MANQQLPNTAWIFDVDGVITNNETRTVVETEILQIIIAMLKNDQPVALNTGRSLAWTIENVVNRFSYCVLLIISCKF